MNIPQKQQPAKLWIGFFARFFRMLTLMQGIVSLTLPVLQRKQVPTQFELQKERVLTVR
jgi:hypothetical protein